jgi:hypothetical protein
VIVAFDLDGVLAHSVPKIYDLNNEHCFEELYRVAPPNHYAIKYVKELVAIKQQLIIPILITGRSEIYRDVTEDWIQKQGIPVKEVYMNFTRDYKKYYISKLHNIRKANANILYDDDEKVVNLVNEHTGCKAIRYEIGCILSIGQNG